MESWFDPLEEIDRQASRTLHWLQLIGIAIVFGLVAALVIVATVH